MNWKQLSKEDSIEKMNILREVKFSPYKYEDTILRAVLSARMRAIAEELGISVQDIRSSGYEVDLLFGLRLYEELTLNKGMTFRDASNLGVWRYLSLEVIPDIVYWRYEDSDARFWKTPRRIWLRAIWLYIHLSWQGTIEGTYRILKNNTTDEIVQLVERSGKYGYRVELYREIMKQYGKYINSVKEPGGKKRITSLFRKVMKLNTAKVQVIEPTLVEGGVESYVRSLFEYFEA